MSNNNKKTLTFMSDILFKFLLTCLKPRDARKILNFITRHILGFIDSGLVVQNPNMNPQYFRQKNITVDTFFASARHQIIIEMQATTMCKRLWNRFIQYLSIVSSRVIHVGEDYENIKPTYMILFTKYYDKRHPQLIVEKTWSDKKYKTLVNQSCQKIYLIQIPYIKEIVKKRKKLTDFEAFIYYLYYDNLKGIEYDDKEGILKLMQEVKNRFMKEEKEMYEEALERLAMTIDYDKLLKANVEDARQELIKENEEKLKRMERKFRKEAKKETRREVRREVKKAEKEVRGHTLTLFQKSYPKEDSSFLEHLSLKQYTQILGLLINNASLDKIKAIVL